MSLQERTTTMLVERTAWHLRRESALDFVLKEADLHEDCWKEESMGREARRINGLITEMVAMGASIEEVSGLVDEARS